MLPKNKRLNLKNDFKWAASGRALETKFVKLFIKFGENTSPRIGIAISSRIFRKATERSRAKRLVSQAFQSTYDLLPTAINIVALPKQGVLSVKSDDILLDMQEKLKDANIIN